MIESESLHPELNKELTYFLCHEFKNPLFAFKAILRHIRMGHSPDIETLDEVLEECNRFETFLEAVLQNPGSITLQKLKALKDKSHSQNSPN